MVIEIETERGMVREGEKGERDPGRGRETEIKDTAAEVGTETEGREVEAGECVCVCLECAGFHLGGERGICPPPL